MIAMKNILLAAGLFFSAYSFSQTCDCAAALEYTINKIETNYAGIRDKLTPATRSRYNVFTDSLKRVAANPARMEQEACTNLIGKWLGFFRDGHLGAGLGPVAPNAALDRDSVRSSYSHTPIVDFSAGDFYTYLDEHREQLKALEGVWQNETGNYRLGIRYENGHYTGFIIKADSVYWMPRQVKMEIIPFADSMQARFYMRDHSLQVRKLNLDNLDRGYIEIGNIGKWFKLDRNGALVFKEYYPNFSTVNFKTLSAKTNLITIKSFNENFRGTIDSIVRANDKVIQSAENLIIDVRGNSGGSDISYYPLNKYLFTHPYVRYNGQIYATEDNIRKFRELATNPAFSKAEQQTFQQMVMAMEAHRNEFWSSDPNPTSGSGTLPVLAMPKHIAVIIDSNCASTTEQFLLDPVLNSSKAVIYGLHSEGVLDYANVYVFNIPGTRIMVQYPTSRSLRIDAGKGIDNLGIPPNVSLENYKGDWVEWVRRQMEK